MSPVDVRIKRHEKAWQQCLYCKVLWPTRSKHLLQVLSEATATKQTRKARAQGLQVLGHLFQQAALAANANAPQVWLRYPNLTLLRVLHTSWQSCVDACSSEECAVIEVHIVQHQA